MESDLSLFYPRLRRWMRGKQEINWLYSTDAQCCITASDNEEQWWLNCFSSYILWSHHNHFIKRLLRSKIKSVSPKQQKQLVCIRKIYHLWSFFYATYTFLTNTRLEITQYCSNTDCVATIFCHLQPYIQTLDIINRETKRSKCPCN